MENGPCMVDLPIKDSDFPWLFACLTEGEGTLPASHGKSRGNSIILLFHVCVCVIFLIPVNIEVYSG